MVENHTTSLPQGTSPFLVSGYVCANRRSLFASKYQKMLDREKRRQTSVSIDLAPSRLVASLAIGLLGNVEGRVEGNRFEIQSYSTVYNNEFLHGLTIKER